MTEIPEKNLGSFQSGGSEAILRAFLDHSPAIAWAKDEDGRVVYLNPSYERTFGVALDDWRGKTDADLWPAEVAQTFRKNDLAVLDGDRSIEVEEETISPDGVHRVWQNLKFPFRDSSGKRYVGGVEIEVTERKLMEAALARREEEYRHVVEYAPASIYEIDYAGPKFKRVNEAVCRLFGYTREELLAMNPMDLLDDGSRIRFQERVRKVMAGEEIHPTVAFRVFPQGRERVLGGAPREAHLY